MGLVSLTGCYVFVSWLEILLFYHLPSGACVLGHRWSQDNEKTLEIDQSPAWKQAQQSHSCQGEVNVCCHLLSFWIICYMALCHNS